MEFESVIELKLLWRIHSYSEENNEPKRYHKAHKNRNKLVNLLELAMKHYIPAAKYLTGYDPIRIEGTTGDETAQKYPARRNLFPWLI